MSRCSWTLMAMLAIGLAPEAQGSGNTKPQEPVRLEMRKAPPLVGSGQLIGIPIKSETLETYGQVEDLILHPAGNLAFAVGSYSGSMDLEKRLFVMPWSVLEFDAENKLLKTGLSEEQMKKVPRFKSDEWPELTDMHWWRNADKDERFKKELKEDGNPVAASATLAPAERLFRLDGVKGEQVYTLADEKVGEIRELGLDPRTGRVSFAVLSVGGFLGTGDKAIAVPWEAFRVVPDPQSPELVRFALETTRERLQEAPGFVAAAVEEQVKDPAWILSVYEFYSVPPYWTVPPAKEAPGPKN